MYQPNSFAFKSVFNRLTTSMGEAAEIALYLKSKSFKENARWSLTRKQLRESKGIESPPPIKVVVEPANLKHNKFTSLRFVKKNSPAAILRPDVKIGYLRPVNEVSLRCKEITISRRIYEALKEVKSQHKGKNISAISRRSNHCS